MNIHIITGGGSGMGLEFAKRIKDGLVIISGRKKEKLENAVKELKECGVNADYKVADITNKEEVKDLFQYGKSKGEICSVINSAGVSGSNAKPELTFTIDLLGAQIVTDQAYEDMKDGGVIILIASMMGHSVPAKEEYDQYLENVNQGSIDELVKFVNGDGNLAYNLSKRGILLMVKREAERFGERNMRIVSISPGIIMTPMAEKAAQDHPETIDFLKKNTPMNRTGRPEDVANAVDFLISDKASFITGSDILVDGGLALNLSRLKEMNK